MKKVHLIVCGVMLAGLMFSGTAQKVKAEDKGPAEIILQTAKAKKPVKFPHASHQERMKCDDCHKSEHFAPSATEWTKDAGHALCRDCHKKNDGPTKCNDCHIKAKKKKLEGC